MKKLLSLFLALILFATPVQAESSKWYYSGDGTKAIIKADTVTELCQADGTTCTDFSGGGGGGAPTDAQYYTAAADATLTNEVVVTGLNTANGVLKGDGAGAISAATEGTDYYAPGGTDVAVADGGTGASTAVDARTNLGLGNVDNTSDADKPVSTAQQTALDAKVDIAGDTMTGILNMGGNALQGSAAASGDLSLSSTSDGTKGNITMGAQSIISGFRYDEANDRISVGGTDNEIVIAGSTLGSKLSVHAEGNADLAEVAYERHTNTAGFGANIIYGRARGTHASPLVVQDNDVVGRLLGVAYDGTDFEQAAEVRFEIDGTPGNDDMPSRMVFLTTPDGASSPVEAMRISQDQTVSTSAGLVVGGDLTVNGTQTSLNTSVVEVEDPNIVLGNVGTPTDVTANGGGIILKGSTDKTITWSNTSGFWEFSDGVDINGGEIDGTTIGANSAAAGTFTTITGTVQTAAQPNITSVGTLTGFTSTGIDDNATSTAVTIDSGQNLGLGTASPRNLAGFTSLGVDGTSGSFLDLFVNGTRQATLSADASSVTFESSTTLPFRIVTNGTAALTADSSQNIDLSANLDLFGDMQIGSDQANDSSISKVFTSAHQAGNQGASIGIGVDDGGNLSGVIVENVASTSAGFNSQEISFKTSIGGTEVATERLRIFQDGVTRLQTAELQLPEIATPSTPPAGFGSFYAKSDGNPYFLNDAGVESQLNAGGSSSSLVVTRGAGEAVLDGSGASTGILSGSPVVIYTEPDDFSAYYTIPVPDGATGIASIEALYENENTLDNLALGFAVERIRDGAARQTDSDLSRTYTTSGTAQSEAITANSAAYNGIGALQDDDILMVRVRRDSSSGSDTYNQTWNAYGVRVTFN